MSSQYKTLKSSQLREIKQRERRATPGPWIAASQVVAPFTKDKVITTKWGSKKQPYPDPVVCVSQSERRATLWVQDNDLDFIAQAREDIPQLLSSLDVYGNRIVYDALLHFLNTEATGPSDRRILEQAIETCWQLVKEKSSKE